MSEQTSQSHLRAHSRHEQSKGRGIPVKACIKCGSVWKKMHYCKAEGETCKSCGKVGHLTKCCLAREGRHPKLNLRINNNDDRRRSYHAGDHHSNYDRTWNIRHYSRQTANDGQNGENVPMTEINTEGQFKQSNEDKYEKSILHYSRLIKLCPEDPQNYNNRSVCYMMAKQYENAIADASKVIELNPSSVENYCRLIKCTIILGCTMEAGIHLKKLTQLDPENKTLLIERKKLSELQGHLKNEKTAVKSNDYEEALKSVCESLVISSENLSMKIRRAEYLALLKHYEESEKIVKEIMEKDCENVDARYILGMKIYDLNIDGAVGYFKKVLELDPGHYKGRVLYEKARRISEKKKQGNDAFLNKDFVAAHNLYSSALEIDPGHKNMKIKLYFNMGQASWNMKKYKRAITEYKNVVNNDAKHYPALKQRGKCYMEIEKYKEAIADFSKVLTLCPTDPDCLQLISDATSKLSPFLGKDPYEILGVSRDASLDEIKRAYNHQELVHDLNRVLNTTEEHQTKHDNDFKEVTLAYKNLLAKMENTSSKPVVDDSSIKFYNLFDG